LETDEHDYQPLTYVSFSIRSEHLDPQIVEDTLGLVADHKHKRGDLPKNDPKFAPYKHGMWSLDSTLAAERPFTDHLESLLDILEPKRDNILKFAKEHSVRFFCSLYSHIGFELPSQLVGRIAAIGADFGVSVYPPDNVDRLSED
jgi:hypothetical protein